LIPVAAEFAVVAPVNAQVNFVTELIRQTGFVVATLAAQVPAPTFGVCWTRGKGWIDVISYNYSI
jgi:hypothetical protein